MSNEHTPELKRILVITSSGGGGLIQTANAKQQEALAKNPNVVIVRKDLLKDWIWKPLGQFLINFWNKAQMKGNISAQSICVWGQFIADFFLHPIIFFYALYTLFKEDVDHIIDTQPLCTSAIVKALRIYNRKRGKHVRLEKVLVDLPTKKATHFFSPIKKLSPENKKLILLTSIAPLLEEGETAEQFWQTTCGLSEKDINLEEVYVRQAFRQFKNKPKSKLPMRMVIRYKNAEEIRLMSKSFEKGTIPAKVRPGEVEFTIEPNDRMITVLLGSQPASEATYRYAKKFAAVAKEFPKAMTYLFVFCADHKEGEDTLFKRVAEIPMRMKNYPKNLSIIPFSFQNEDVIASLFYRSDINCTRSGGQTAMELMCVSTGEMFIHSEAKKGQDLLEGIPGWESASAVYLQKVRGAKIVTPDTVSSVARRLYQTGNAQALANRPLESTA
ncbi:MAG: hypothetical protein K1X28_00330 [Parachlamydiales bacterium]|nr:hypothetical protein [Parachlamydiales bacterium]